MPHRLSSYARYGEGVIKLTDKKRRGKIEAPSTLYLGLIKNIAISVFVAFFCYLAVRIGMDLYINKSYLAEENKSERLSLFINELEEFVDGEDITHATFYKLAEWASDEKYRYMLVYDDEGELIFSTEIKSAGQNGGGVTVGYPTVEELAAMAQSNGSVTVLLEDGSVIYVSVAEYSEYFYYDMANVLSLLAAVLALGVVLVNYFRQIISRIKKLEREVSIVSSGNTEHLIFTEGRDEISSLSEMVERMRRAMLVNLEREREAREANKELVTSMSHDIRTPLTVLLGYLDMMKTQTGDDEVLHSYVISSEKTAMRLKTLSDEMFKYSLAFGDVGAGVDLEEYDARTLAEQMLSEHVLLLMENGYDVRLENIDNNIEEGSFLLTDAPNLMRIIDNIFSNIRKYADPAKPIVISARRVGGSVVIFEFRNSILKDNHGAESNRIGLRTCVKLAKFIAEGFSYDTDGDEFVAKLSIKLIPPTYIG